MIKKSFALLFVALAFSLSVQAAAPSCGLTIITHGFEPPYPIGNGALPGWVREMAQGITNRIGASIPIYRIRYDKASDTVLLQDGAISIDITQAGGVIILLDWVGVANETLDYPTQNVADRFFDYLFGQQHNGHYLVELPIHLIGHSRGGSLNSRLAYDLAGNGILVEQVTSLDPHPVTDAGANDWPATTYINTIFADNYYRTGAFPAGQAVPGAANNDLSSTIDGDDCSEHESVHTYYQGTINLAALTDGNCNIQNIWYQQSTARDETGYNFSRYTNLLLARPVSGLNQFIANAGGSGSRVSVDTSFQYWPNAGFDQRATFPDHVTVGESVSIPYYYADRSSQQTIIFYTDGDTNPFNGEQSQIGSVTQSSRPAGSIGSSTLSWTPTAADIGTHYIRVKTTNTRTDVVRVRCDYLLKRITVQAALTPTPTITSVSPATLPPSSSPQLITIYGSNFLPSGDPNASTLMFYDPANNSYTRTPTYISTGELRYNVTVQSATGTWKVKVVNGSTESLPFSFTVASSGVQLTGLSISGPATVAENNNGQFNATAYFSDGTSSTVTSSTSWSDNSSVTSISSSGLLSAGSVSSDTAVTVSASYTFNGVTKTTSANITIVNSGSGGGTTTVHPLVNGTFESGSSPWAPSGYAGVVALSYPHLGSWYAYLCNANSADGAFGQLFAVPAGTTSATIQFYLNVVSSETSTTTEFDAMNVDLGTANEQYVGRIAHFSNLDKGANVNGNYVLKNYDITSLISSYKGQSLFLTFGGHTDTNLSTIFRIDDVDITLTVNNPVSLTGLSIRGPSSIPEGRGDTFWADAIFSDGTTQTISPNSWSENSSVTTITSDGFLLAGSVSLDTPVTVTASYTFSGVTQQATKSVTIVDTNATHTLSLLAISGPSSMNENSSGQFTATAIFTDGTSQSVTPSWSDNSTATSISSGGLLTAGDVSSDMTVTVSASYTTGGVTRNASQDVLIINAPTPPTFTSLAISGASSVNENSTAQYSATAFFSDGSSQTVNPTWSEDSAAASISIFGLLSAEEVTSDTPVTISASYTSGGVTRNAQKVVTVLNVTYTVTPSAGANGSISPNTPQTVDSGGSLTFNASPSSGYVVDQWLVNGNARQTGGTSFTLSYVFAATSVQVTFKPSPTKIISLSGNLAFGNVPVGTSAQSTLTISNTGNSTLAVSSISYPSGFNGNWSSGMISAGGSQDVAVTFSPTSAASYTGDVTVISDATSGANTKAVSGTGTSCTYSLPTTSASFDSGGGSSNFTVNAGSGCAWNATTADGWITINSGSGVGNGAVSYTVATDFTSNSRLGTVNVANQAFTVYQTGAGGGTVIEVIASGLYDPASLLLDTNDIYFTDNTSSDGVLKRVAKAGGSVATLITGAVLSDGVPRGIGGFAIQDSAIYGDYGGYGKMNIFSASKNGGSTTTLASPTGGKFIGVVGSTLYYSSGFSNINAIPTNGGSSSAVLSNVFVRSSAIDGTSIYFVDNYYVVSNTMPVKKFDVGSQTVSSLISGNNVEGSIFIDAGSVYLSRGGSILKVSKVGGAVTTLVNSTQAMGYASDNSKVFLVESNVIKSIPVQGGLVTSLTNIPAGSLSSLAVDNSYLYWTDLSGGPGNSKILRMLKPGNAIAANFNGTPTNGAAPLTVNFSDASTGAITNQFWDFGDGQTTNTLATNVVHSYTSDGTFTLTLIVSGPLGASTNTKPNFIQVGAPPTVTVTAPIPNASETGPTAGQFKVTRTGSTSSSLTVFYSIGGTASNGMDYVALPGSVTIPIGLSEKTITDTPIDDSVVEGNETMILTLLTNAAYTVGSPNSATNTITDNDVLPTVTVTAPVPNASETGPTPGQFKFTRTGSTGASLTVFYAIGGTASNGVDYVALPGSVTIPIGLSEKTIADTPIDDSIPEGSESVILTVLSNALYAVGLPNSATNLIADNDFAPVASFSGSPTNGVAPLSVTFTDTSTGTITNRFWDFGDGVTLNTTATNVAHTYGVAGTNTVTLIASGPVGVSTNMQASLITVLVYPPGDVNGTFTVNAGDSLLINQVAVNLRTTNDAAFAGAGYANGDVNQDGVVGTGDAGVINQVVVHLRSYVVTKALPNRRTNNVPTQITIYGVGFPTNVVPSVTIGTPVNLTLSNVVVVSHEQITALVPAGGGLGTGTVNVVSSPTNGVISFGQFINQ